MSTEIETTQEILETENDFKLFTSKRQRKESAGNIEMEQDDEIETEEMKEDETKKLKFPPVSADKLSVSLKFKIKIIILVLFT